MDPRFFICSICGQLIHVIDDKNLPMTCCMTDMTEIVPNVTEKENGELHLPVVTRHDNIVNVQIGKKPHPMTPEHYIKWILIHTKKGCQRIELEYTDKPCADFHVAPDDEVLSVYAYCNVHGLWKI